MFEACICLYINIFNKPKNPHAMKKELLFVFFLFLCISLKSQIQVSSTGHIGLGTTASTNYSLVSAGTNYFTDCLSIGETPDLNYKLKVNGNSYFNGYLGLGVAPNLDYRLNLSGNSYFSGTSRFVGNTFISGGNLNLSGSFSLTNPNECVSLSVASSSIHAPCAVFTSPSNYYSQAIVHISGGNGNHYGLYVGGDAYSTGSWIGSDSQLKKNISTF